MILFSCHCCRNGTVDNSSLKCDTCHAKYKQIVTVKRRKAKTDKEKIKKVLEELDGIADISTKEISYELIKKKKLNPKRLPK